MTRQACPGTGQRPSSRAPSAAEADILDAGLRCMNIQVERLHVEATTGLLGRRHREGLLGNHAVRYGTR